MTRYRDRGLGPFWGLRQTELSLNASYISDVVASKKLAAVGNLIDSSHVAWEANGQFADDDVQ